MPFKKPPYGNQSQSGTQYFRNSSQSTSNAPFALLESVNNPRLTVTQFPHRGPNSEERKRKKSGSENGQQKQRLRDDDRKGHLDIILRATEQFLAQGEITKAAKAFGIILQLKPRTQSIDIRLHNLWSIGAEILIRQRGKLRDIDQPLSAHEDKFAGGSSDGIQVAGSRWAVSSNMSEIKSYFEILIRQYAYDYKLPHKVSAVDFWLALLSCELNNIYADHLGSIALLQDEMRLQRTDSPQQDIMMPLSPNTSDFASRRSGFVGDDSGLQHEFKQHRVTKGKGAICQRTLTGLQDVNLKMEKLMDQLPYSKNRHFLQLREMTSLLSIDLGSPTPDISGS
ncbi:hypothetical protein V8C37DRAFT_300774 [Trichoderma ceciliae]